MRVNLYILGGKTGEDALTELGASCYLLVITVNGALYCYLIDCGMETRDDAAVSYAAAKDLHIIKNFRIDHVFVTHAHRDHAAAFAMKIIAACLKQDARVITTKTSAKFLPFVMHEQNRVSNRRSEKTPYGQYEIYNFLKRLDGGIIEEPGEIELVPGAIWVYPLPSAHIRGACSYIFRIREGAKEVKIMFSGDYCTHDQLTTSAAPLPPRDWYPDIIASFDCTNGAEDLTQGRCAEERFWQNEMKRMADDGNNTVKAGGMAFYYAFALDRSPTFAQALAGLGLPVWLDGPSAIELTARMLDPDGSWCAYDTPLDMSDVRIAQKTFQPLDELEPCAIVAPGGMGHGPAVEYFKRLLPQENCLVGASGYQAHGTNGWRIGQKKRGETVRIDTDAEEDLAITIAARTEKYRATAHSLRGMAANRIEELLKYSQFIKNDTPIVGLCHGAAPALDWFENRLAGMTTFRQDRANDRHIALVG